MRMQRLPGGQGRVIRRCLSRHPFGVLRFSSSMRFTSTRPTVALRFAGNLAVSACGELAVSGVQVARGDWMAFKYFFMPPVGAVTIVGIRRTGWRCSRYWYVHLSGQPQLVAHSQRREEAAPRRARVERLFKSVESGWARRPMYPAKNAIPDSDLSKLEAGAADLF